MGVLAQRTARRRKLGSELKALRVAAEVSPERAAQRIHGDNSKISRIEKGRQRVTRLELDALLELYRVGDAKLREGLVLLSAEARRRSWWRQYGDLLHPSFQEVLEMESDAARICAFQPLLIPGLLQTKEYATAVIREFPDESGKDLDAYVALRMGRQRILERQALQYVCVLTENTLRQEVGGPEVMAAQLRHLRAMSKPPDRTIQVIPYDRGAHIGLAGGFTLYAYPDPMDLDVVGIEYLDGGLYREEARPVARYRMAFDQLRSTALSSRQSMELISRIAGELDTR